MNTAFTDEEYADGFCNGNGRAAVEDTGSGYISFIYKDHAVLSHSSSANHAM
jgi:hypothetical protein